MSQKINISTLLNESDNTLSILKSFFSKKKFKKVNDVLQYQSCRLIQDKYILKVTISKIEKNAKFIITQEYIIDKEELNTFYNRENKFINILD